MGRTPCCKPKGLRKGPWTAEEDNMLMAYVQHHGHGTWGALPAKAGLKRCGKSCRLRWINYLRPDIKRGKFTPQEDQTIIQLHALLGNRWSVIATHLSKRTDNEIKNHWNTHLKKRLVKMGIDPVTHKPRADILSSASHDTANLRHTAQWEHTRLETEARLVRESKLTVLPTPASADDKLPHCSSVRRIGERIRPPCLDVLKAWQGIVSCMFTASTMTTNQVKLLESPTSLLDDSGLVTPTGYQINQNNLSTLGNNSSMAAPIYNSPTMYQPAYINEGKTGLWFEDVVFACDNDININGVGSGTLNESINDVGNGSGEEAFNYWDCLLNLVSGFTSGSPAF